MNWSRGYLPSVSCCYILVKVPSPYPCPSVAYPRLAPFMEGEGMGEGNAGHQQKPGEKAKKRPKVSYSFLFVVPLQHFQWRWEEASFDKGETQS